MQNSLMSKRRHQHNYEYHFSRPIYEKSSGATDLELYPANESVSRSSLHTIGKRLTFNTETVNEGELFDLDSGFLHFKKNQNHERV